MGLPSSPGSYVSEKDLSQRVRAVSTSIGAIVGASKKGPIMETVLVTNEQELISVFGKPDPKFSMMHYAALEFLNKSSRLYVTRVVNDDAARGPLPLTGGAIYTVDAHDAIKPRPSLNVFDDGTSRAQGLYDPFNTFAFNPSDPAVQNQLFMVCAVDPGTWNNDLYVCVRPSLKPEVAAFDDFYDDPTAFWIDVYLDYKSTRQPPNESFFVKRSPAVDGYGNQLFIEDVVNTKSKLIRVRNNEFADAGIKVLEEAKAFLAGATDGGRVSMGQMRRGWDLYRDPETIDVNILIQGGAPIGMTKLQDIADIQRHMTQVAEKRMDCVAVLDMPKDLQETADAVTYRKVDLNLDSSYAAMYSPDVKIRDKFNDLELFVPPSGFAAAAYAHTDDVAASWFAPAGMLRGHLDVLSARHIYNQGHRDALNDAQINPIRFFPNGAGYKIWGADTMQVQASALTNVSVRRLMNFIEKSVGLANAYSVFDPNDQVLRSRISSMISQFLQPIRDAGGLYWFEVVCDETNNPPASIAAGILVVDAYFDPVIMAKRIRLNANLMKTGASYREYVSERS